MGICSKAFQSAIESAIVVGMLNVITLACAAHFCIQVSINVNRLRHESTPCVQARMHAHLEIMYADAVGQRWRTRMRIQKVGAWYSQRHESLDRRAA